MNWYPAELGLQTSDIIVVILSIIFLEILCMVVIIPVYFLYKAYVNLTKKG